MQVLIEKYNLTSDKVQDTIKIALFADLHYTDTTLESFNDNIVYTIKKISPNYIFIAGDYLCAYYLHFKPYDLNVAMSMETIKKLLYELSRIAPVILSLGNHDLTVSNETELRKAFRELKEENIYPLDDESIEFDDICFSGFCPSPKSYAILKISNNKIKTIINNWNSSNLQSCENKFSVLGCHIPDIILDKRIQQEAKDMFSYDLILSAHAHNGWLSPKQERRKEEKIDKMISKLSNGGNIENLRILRAKLEARKYQGYCESIMTFPPFVRKISRGMHEVNGTKLIISKGITSGSKFGLGNKIMVHMNRDISYVTEVEISPKLKKKIQ